MQCQAPCLAALAACLLTAAVATPQQRAENRENLLTAADFETPSVVARVLGQLANIGEGIAGRVGTGLGYTQPIEPVLPAVPARTDLPPSPMLSILAKAKPTLEGRRVGALVSKGVDTGVLTALRAAVIGAGGALKVVALKVGGVTGSDGTAIRADMQLAGAPSVLFDAVALLVSEAGADALLQETAAGDFVRNAYAHCKVIGHTSGAAKLLARAGIPLGGDPGVVMVGDAGPFLAAAKQGRVWGRKAQVRLMA